MKTLLSVLLLSIVLGATGQTYNPMKPSEKTWWHKWGHMTTGILYQATTHGLNAAGDAYLHRNKYQTNDPRDMTIGKTLNMTSQIMMFADYPLFVLTNKELNLSWGGFLERGLQSVFIRVIVFDPVHNVMIGEKYDYIGDVSLTDKFWQATATGENQNGGWWPVRIVCVGAVFGINYW